MTKNYNFQSVEDIPVDLVEHIATLTENSIAELSIEEINDLLNEVETFNFAEIKWAWEDSGIEFDF